MRYVIFKCRDHGLKGKWITESQFNKTNEVIFILSSSEKPSPPLSPVVSGITKDSCVVSWKPPLNDGGSKIKSYCLEKKQKKDKKEWSDWTAVTTDEIKQTVFSVKRLTEGVEHIFRVKCENLGGESDYSEETAPVLPATAVEIRAPAFKEELRHMSVKYKSNATFVCKITGQPKPVIKWLRRGKEIQSDGKKIKIQEFKGGYHQLVVVEADEEDSTVYQIRATNQGGSICATVSLDVESKLTETCTYMYACIISVHYIFTHCLFLYSPCQDPSAKEPKGQGSHPCPTWRGGQHQDSFWWQTRSCHYMAEGTRSD